MFRQLSYLIQESVRGIRQHHSVVLPSLITIFLCSLLLAASFAAFAISVKILSVEKSMYTVEAFLPESVTNDSLKIIRNNLEHTKHVGNVTFISADSAMEDFRKHFSKDMLELVEGNPIPPFFKLELDENSKNPVELAELQQTLKRKGFFEEVQAPLQWVEKISSWKFRMLFWPACISVLLLCALSLIICNSVKLSLMSRRLLIENMKYAGGSHFFIEFPFVLQGAILGFVGSISAVLLLYFIIHSVALSFPIIFDCAKNMWLMFMILVALVTIISAYFSFKTVREFLNVKRSEQE